MLIYQARILFCTQCCKLYSEDLASFSIICREYNSRFRRATKELTQSLGLFFQFPQRYIEPFSLKKANPDMTHIFGEPCIIWSFFFGYHHCVELMQPAVIFVTRNRCGGEKGKRIF